MRQKVRKWISKIFLFYITYLGMIFYINNNLQVGRYIILWAIYSCLIPSTNDKYKSKLSVEVHLLVILFKKNKIIRIDGLEIRMKTNSHYKYIKILLV